MASNSNKAQQKIRLARGSVLRTIAKQGQTSPMKEQDTTKKKPKHPKTPVKTKTPPVKPKGDPSIWTTLEDTVKDLFTSDEEVTENVKEKTKVKLKTPEKSTTKVDIKAPKSVKPSPSPEDPQTEDKPTVDLDKVAPQLKNKVIETYNKLITSGKPSEEQLENLRNQINNDPSIPATQKSQALAFLETLPSTMEEEKAKLVKLQPHTKKTIFEEYEAALEIETPKQAVDSIKKWIMDNKDLSHKQKLDIISYLPILPDQFQTSAPKVKAFEPSKGHYISPLSKVRTPNYWARGAVGGDYGYDFRARGQEYQRGSIGFEPSTSPAESFSAALDRFKPLIGGVPYTYGGKSFKGGIDCSGFVQQILRPLGVNPKGVHNANGLFQIFSKEGTTLSAPQPGALVFYEPEEDRRSSMKRRDLASRKITHIAIMADQSNIFESASGTGVNMRPYHRPGYKHYFILPKYPENIQESLKKLRGEEEEQDLASTPQQPETQETLETPQEQSSQETVVPT